ncbi:MAG TPA: hypothetical protein DCW74_17530 [Alteromonas australica]|uniref:Uncharacterized protein n=1 Tax=Alteromonas australica TaxID=589873 RepID=A0A350P8A2_9ALTE|nr:hypothetical protein [Alteromonas australica]
MSKIGSYILDQQESGNLPDFSDNIQYGEYRMSLEIEKDIPIPRKMSSPIPFDDMEIGDSVFVPETNMNSSNVRTQASNKNTKANGKRYTVHKEDGGCRVFRTL